MTIDMLGARLFLELMHVLVQSFRLIEKSLKSIHPSQRGLYYNLTYHNLSIVIHCLSCSAHHTCLPLYVGNQSDTKYYIFRNVSLFVPT